MPAPVRELIVTPSPAAVQIRVEPALGAVHSLLLLAKMDRISGLGDWVADTTVAMTDEERQRHKLVMIGFFYAIVPERSHRSFPAYLDYLEKLPPLALRDKLLEAYANLPCCDGNVQPTDDDRASILASAENYMDYLGSIFSPEYIDAELESQAYNYVIEPQAMQSIVVSHLRSMWHKYLAAEWDRVKPMLEDSAAAFNQVDFGQMDQLEVAQFITGQALDDDHWGQLMARAEQVIFVPSAHAGPYLGNLMVGDTLAIVFGARLPEGTRYYAPDLSRAEILVRLNALADDTRLMILRLIADEGEKRSIEIIEHLSLSQSAASRHLKQLSATGYLIERRCEGAKCYTLNMERVRNTLNAVATYLGGS